MFHHHSSTLHSGAHSSLISHLLSLMTNTTTISTACMGVSLSCYITLNQTHFCPYFRTSKLPPRQTIQCLPLDSTPCLTLRHTSLLKHLSLSQKSIDIHTLCINAYWGHRPLMRAVFSLSHLSSWLVSYYHPSHSHPHILLPLYISHSHHSTHKTSISPTETSFTGVAVVSHSLALTAWSELTVTRCTLLTHSCY